MKTFRVSFICGLLLTVFSIVSMAQSVQTDYDHSFNLARLKTYGFYQLGSHVRHPFEREFV